MPQKAKALNTKPTSRRKPPLYVVRLPRVEPALRVWVNPKSTDDILTFAIMFGRGNVKLLPNPQRGIIALESEVPCFSSTFRVASSNAPRCTY